MPRIYSGVPSASDRDGGKSDVAKLQEKFAHHLQHARSGAATFEYDEALHKLETLNHIDQATSCFREIFLLTGHTHTKNSVRGGLLSLLQALKDSSYRSLHRYLPEVERINFQAEKMLLTELINELASPDLETHQRAAKVTILHHIEISCLNTEHGRLAKQAREKVLKEYPEVAIKGGQDAPGRMRRRQGGRAQDHDALQSPQGRGLQPRPNQPTRAAFITPRKASPVAAPSPVNKSPVVLAFARRIEEHSHFLHSRYAILQPEAQHGLFRDITKLFCEFSLNTDAQNRPGESAAVASELKKLVDGQVGFLRRLDKTSRENMKQALGILRKSSNPTLAKLSKEALSDMTPYYVLKELPKDKLTYLLTGIEPNTFIVTSAPFPAEEFCIYLNTTKKIRRINVTESRAANGAVLYSIDGLHQYSNLATLVHKELQNNRGFVLAGTPQAAPPKPAWPQQPAGNKAALPSPEKARPAVPAPAPDKEVRIKRGTKFGKKQVGSLRISHLRSENGNEYIISNTQAQGGFGKFRYAVDARGNRWAVKEFRSEFARHKRRAKTNITNLDEINAEIQIMNKLDATCQVVDAINISGKVYAIMPIMSGEVEDVVKRVPSSEKKVMARNILRQMTSELAKCHKQGYIHRDVKLANALWSPDGQVALSDFGLTVPRPKPPSMLYDLAGTPPFMAPEMFGSTGYDHMIDTWSLALAVAGIHVDWWESPFLPPRNGDRKSWALANFRRYQVWRSGLMKNGKLDMRLVGTRSTPFDVYFRKLEAADHELCWLMLSRMLVVDPSERSSPERIRYHTKTIQSAGSPEDLQAQRAFAALEQKNDEKKAAFDLLDKERRGQL